MPNGILIEPAGCRRIRDGRHVVYGERLCRAIAEGGVGLTGLVVDGAVDVCRIVLHLLLLAIGLLLLIQLLVVLLILVGILLLVLLLLIVLLVLLLALLVRSHVHVGVALCGRLHVGLLCQVLFSLFNSFHRDSVAPKFLVFRGDLVHP